jgi:hypothetical protein
MSDVDGSRSGAGGPDDDPDEPSDIPDDASELAFEAEALRRERAARRRRERVLRIFRTRRFERYGLSGPMVAVVLVIVALFGSLMVVLGPRPPARLGAQPLADAPSGGPGGLLPDVRLQAGTREVPARSLRPGILALVSDGCDCAAAVQATTSQAASYRLQTSLVVTPESADDLRTMRDAGAVRAAAAGVDADAVLEATYAPGATGLTLLLVRADGVVEAVVRDVAETTRLEADLSELAERSAPDA